MKTLYIDCSMGAAGDMLTAALLELLPDQEQFVKEMNELGIPGVKVEKETSVKCGITGTHVSVKVHGEEEDEHMHEHHHHDHNEHEHHHHDHDEHEHHHHDHDEHEHHHHDHDEHEHHHHDHDEHEHHHHDHDEHEHHHHDHDEHEHHHDHDEHEHHHHDHEEHHHHAHHHSSMHDVEHIVSHLNVSDKVKQDVLAVYNLIAEAESVAHGKPVTEIHFHEVGTMDAIADVTAVCILMEKVGAEKIVVSPVHVGSGQVKCAHGILPVPAPATAYILKDCPIYGGSIKSELCTPTGAALLKHFATEFGSMPAMKTEKIGYGMGKKDFEAANCVRIMLGENFDGEKPLLEAIASTELKSNKSNVNIANSNIVNSDIVNSDIVNSDIANSDKVNSHIENGITTLSCNIDDMTAEDIGFAMDELFNAGAREVFTSPIYMKKNRPGTLLTVICDESKKNDILSQIFKNTTTIGVREFVTQRYVLKREIQEINTAYGVVRKKVSSGYGVVREKLEHDDLVRIAKEKQMSLDEVRSAIK